MPPRYHDITLQQLTWTMTKERWWDAVCAAAQPA